LIPERETIFPLARTTFQQRLFPPDAEGGMGENWIALLFQNDFDSHRPRHYSVDFVELDWDFQPLFFHSVEGELDSFAQHFPL
jgi:hypothetical protein